MAEQHFDLLVIGGGINGAAVARDAAGRGMSVMLAERGDYAGATSSASSKLIHGGLRYLERFEFLLVRESLRERELLLKTAPHLVRPLRFLVPVYAGSGRAAWMLRFGLWLYDRLAGSGRLEKSGALGRQEIAALPHLRRKGLKAVLHYSDCQVDDARLVLALLLDARARGADISNAREVRTITPVADGYRVTLCDRQGERTIRARFCVNAAGPWVNQVAALYQGPLPRLDLRLVRGSHILLPMPEPPLGDALTLQKDDGRVVFVIPWFDRRHLMVGTTDVPHDGDPADVRCSDAERDYLLAACNTVLSSQSGPRTPQDIVWSWAGVRPLIDDGTDNPSKVSRDSRILTRSNGKGGFVQVYGGKLTSHRRLAEKVMDALAGLGAAAGPSWTGTAPLPGGAMTPEELEELARSAAAPLPLADRRRLCATYGDAAAQLFERIAANSDAAGEIAPGVTKAELEHALHVEDARNGEDFLYRRTKLFLSLAPADRDAIGHWFKQNSRH